MVNAGVKKKSNKIQGTTSDRIFDVVNFIIALLALLIVLIPLLNVVASSFSSGAAVQAGKVGIIPVEPTLDAYIEVFQYGDVWIGYRNTIYYTVVGTLLNIVFTVLMAYPLARADLKGRGIIMKLLVFTMMFSGGLIPNYLLVKDLNLLNTPWALWLPGLISVYNVIVMRTFFQTTIPKELLEAAKSTAAPTADSCGPWCCPCPRPSWPLCAALRHRSLEQLLQRHAPTSAISRSGPCRFSCGKSSLPTRLT